MSMDSINKNTLPGLLEALRIKFDAIAYGFGACAFDLLAMVLASGGHINEYRRAAEILAMIKTRGGVMPLLEVRRLSEFLPCARRLMPESREIDDFLRNLHSAAESHKSYAYKIIEQERALEAFRLALVEALRTHEEIIIPRLVEFMRNRGIIGRIWRKAKRWAHG